ncbi:hypothetical protein GYMLUDRAFT_265587 [Collybiopsis luxurians FD-317 M1]|uniref:Uncharacterized protein n=1 Tax=Collybiopsis luxurians FD-317 M1 TaxID=944289 RepID=A0A0D0BR08_9AGAR|nr:hypothetical protein GYMLUDRAFT_265587 [Collybiopsis luxurians FD-317 M1]
MSLGEADAKFPSSGSLDIPPSPTVENPGQVYPKSDPHAARLGTIPGAGRSNSSQTLIGNPFLMREAFLKIDHALGNVIDILEREEMSVGGSEDENELLKKFRQWRGELDEIRAGHRTPESRSRSRVPPEREGGMFTD